MSEKVYVVTDSGVVRDVDPAPLPAERFNNGHFWIFDHGVTDLDAPYTCGLCNEPQWRAYGVPCAEGRTPAELNAERAAWIEERRFTGTLPWYVPAGLSPAFA